MYNEVKLLSVTVLRVSWRKELKSNANPSNRCETLLWQAQPNHHPMVERQAHLLQLKAIQSVIFPAAPVTDRNRAAYEPA